MALKLRLCAVLLTLFAGAAVHAQEVSGGPEGDAGVREATVKAPVLRLRSGPGEVYRVLGEYEQGAKMAVVGRRGAWLEVKIPDGVALFVSDRYVDAEGVVKVGRLNVRPRPTTRYQSMGQVAKDQVLTVLGRKDGWVAVAAPEGITAWVSAENVTLAAPAVPAKVGADAGGTETAADPGQEAEAGLAGAGTEEAGTTEDAGDDLPLAIEIPEPDVFVPDPFQAVYEEALREYRNELAKGLSSAVLGPVADKFDRVIEGTEDEILAFSARQAVTRCRKVMALQAEFEGYNRKIEQALQRRAVTEARPAAPQGIREASPTEAGFAGRPLVRKPAIDESTFAATGWVEPAGKFFGREGTHLLVVGGRTRAWLHLDGSLRDDIDLNRYIGKRIGVRGRTAAARDGHAVVVDVTEIVVLSHPR